MLDEDKKRIKRKLVLTVLELETLVQVLGKEQYHHFCHGNVDQTEFLRVLKERLKTVIEKESP